eukprot:859902-Pyramimonas_sp.AAC.1
MDSIVRDNRSLVAEPLDVVLMMGCNMFVLYGVGVWFRAPAEVARCIKPDRPPSDEVQISADYVNLPRRFACI